MNYLGAMTAGYTVEQVLNYLSRNFPDLGPRIKQAVNSGKSPEDIMKYISKFDRSQLAKLKSNKKPFEPFPESGISNRYIQAQQAQKELNPIPESVQKGALGAAGLAAGSLAAPAVVGALQRALPKNILQPELLNQSLQGIVSPSHTITSQGKNNTDLDKTPISSPLQPPINTNIVQQQQTLPQPELKTIDSKQVLQNNNFIDKVESLINSGNDAESIEGFYQKFNPSAVKKIEKEAGKSFREVVSEYMQSKLAEKPPEELPPEFPGEEPPRPPKPKYPPPPEKGGLLSRKAIEESFKKATPSKGSIVDTPNGIGEVREIRNGKALVEVDGKMRKMLEEELMEPGLPQKDLADLHEELIEGIKQQTGKEVSRHVEWAGYDPEHKELVYRPWGDKEYVYDNIDPEDVEMLTNLLTQRKTTGENYIGSWEAGTESPIGAAMHALITKVRNKAKESGQEKAHKRRYEAVYSAYEPAQKASKQKKDAEKKRLKDEEKRRKAKEKQALQHSRSPSRVS